MRFMVTVIASLLLLLAVSAGSRAWAAEGSTAALIEVLHDKGVLDDASYSELIKAGPEGGESVEKRLIEVLYQKGVLDEASYRKLTGEAVAEKPAAPAAPVAVAEAEAPKAEAKPADRPLDKTLTSIEEGIARLSGDNVKLKIGLFFQGGWLNDDAGFSVGVPPTTNRSTTSGNQFFVRRARFFFDGQLADKVGFKVSLEAADAGGKVLRDAYFYADYIPYARITLGQQKVPFGLEGVEALSNNPTINRSLITNFAHAPTLRDLGISLSGKYQTKLGNLPLGAGYAAGVFNGSGLNTTDDNDYKDVEGRVYIMPLVPGLTLGGSWSVGRTHHAGDINKDHDRLAADLDYNPGFVKGLKVRGEYMQQRKYFENYASKNITETSGLPAFGRHTHAYGWYVLAAYRVDGLDGILGYLNGLEPVVRYDFLDEDKAVADNERYRTTLGINYYFTKWARLMANYEITHADGALKARSLETIDTIGHHLFTTQVQFKF